MRDKVVALPRRDHPGGDTQAETATAGPSQASVVEERIRKLATGNAALAEGLLAINREDRTFDPDQFMNGARAAYEMIVTAFAEGNRKVLRGLLSKEVFDGFSAAIAEREARGEQIDQSFVGINKAEMVEAELKKGVAQISVRFVSELISATRDKAGTVLSGDPKRIKEVVDIWTFAREVASRDPNWKLVATQAAG
jgi:predicted lipid-binding transport protein (Tim44 family)